MSPIPSASTMSTATTASSDASESDGGGNSLKMRRDSLRLNFSTDSPPKKKVFSPDLLSLGKMISQAAAAAATPTPTTMLFPTEVSMAQRQYAQGFLDALNQVQKMNGFVPAPHLISPTLIPGLFQAIVPSTSEQSKVISSPVISPTRESFSVIMQAMSGMGGLAYGGFPPLTPTSLYSAPPSHASHPPHPVMPSTSSIVNAAPVPPQAEVKTEPILNTSDDSKESYDMYADTNNDTEGCSSTRSNNSPQSQDELVVAQFPSDSPYDVGEQERRKLERKRARNRMAATKCRQRKLQRISELEKQVGDEKATGNRLSQELKLLETSIAQLRQTLHEHRSRGCVVPSK